ncbi:protease inhibitor I42 family protein [Gammaproteobacteria bacterium]|nr:protease inhibitor I42 family protein [Gammaproteobacteria bacterium]
MKAKVKVVAFILCIFFVVDILFAQENIIQLKKNQPNFSILLYSSPTTGYSWSLKKYNKNLIELTGHEYVKHKSSKMGASSYEKWSFHATDHFFDKNTSTRIILDYFRPWETKAPLKTLTYKIVLTR